METFALHQSCYLLVIYVYSLISSKPCGQILSKLLVYNKAGIHLTFIWYYNKNPKLKTVNHKNEEKLWCINMFCFFLYIFLSLRQQNMKVQSFDHQMFHLMCHISIWAQIGTWAMLLLWLIVCHRLLRGREHSLGHWAGPFAVWFEILIVFCQCHKGCSVKDAA